MRSAGPDEPPRATSKAISSQNQVHASPVVRALARQHTVNIADIAATGPGNRVVKDDILRHVASLTSATIGAVADEVADEVPRPAAAAAPEQGSIFRSGVESSQPGHTSGTGHSAHSTPHKGDELRGEVVSVPLRGYQRAMVRSMTEGAACSPL